MKNTIEDIFKLYSIVSSMPVNKVLQFYDSIFSYDSNYGELLDAIASKGVLGKITYSNKNDISFTYKGNFLFERVFGGVDIHAESLDVKIALSSFHPPIIDNSLLFYNGSGLLKITLDKYSKVIF